MSAYSWTDECCAQLNVEGHLRRDWWHLRGDGSSSDPVTRPAHYRQHPSGVECIQITEHMSFTLGNVIKYVWRADLKADAVEDLRKAVFYLEREIDRRERADDATKSYYAARAAQKAMG